MGRRFSPALLCLLQGMGMDMGGFGLWSLRNIFFFRCEFFYGQCYYTMAGKRVGWTGYRFFKFTFFLLTPILKGIMAGRYNDMLGYEYD